MVSSQYMPVQREQQLAAAGGSSHAQLTRAAEPEEFWNCTVGSMYLRRSQARLEALAAQCRRRERGHLMR